jgi:hypothetical protein
MRDLSNFDKAECEELEGDIRAMCDKLKFAAPPSEYSLEGAIEKIIGGRVNPAAAGLFPPFATTMGEFYRSLATVFTAQRLSNLASSIIVLMMLMIIPLALFSNRSMAMNTSASQAHSLDRGTPVNDEDLKLECTKYLCGDKRYEK